MRLKFGVSAAAVFLVLSFLVPVQPSKAATDQAKASVHISIADATVGSTKLNPGEYDIKADGATLTFAWSSTGRVVAQAPIQWKDASSKAAATTLEYDGTKIVGVRFKGKARFAEISN